MKLYMHPVSMTSRPVRLFIAENNIRCDEQVVDLMTGDRLWEHLARLVNELRTVTAVFLELPSVSVDDRTTVTALQRFVARAVGTIAH